MVVSGSPMPGVCDIGERIIMRAKDNGWVGEGIKESMPGRCVLKRDCDDDKKDGERKAVATVSLFKRSPTTSEVCFIEVSVNPCAGFEIMRE